MPFFLLGPKVDIMAQKWILIQKLDLRKEKVIKMKKKMYDLNLIKNWLEMDQI